MTRMCVVCKKLYTKGSDKSFHSFPKNENRKQLWLKACKMKLYLPSYTICDDHFLPEHYLLSGYLKKNAVPFLTSTKTDIKPLVQVSSPRPCPRPMKLCVEPITSSSTYIKPLVQVSSPRSCPSPMKLCVEPITSSSTDIKPLVQVSSPRSCPSPMKLCVEPITSSSTYNDHDYSMPYRRKHKVFNANTVGVLSPSHFSTPKMAKIHLDMVKHKYKEKQIQNANLKKQIKRLKQKLTTYDDIIQKLRQKQFLTDNPSVRLQVKC